MRKSTDNIIWLDDSHPESQLERLNRLTGLTFERPPTSLVNKPRQTYTSQQLNENKKAIEST